MGMSEHFQLDCKAKDGWVVSWPNKAPLTKAVGKQAMLDVLFNDLKCDNVGLGVALVSGELEYIWVTSIEYWMDTEQCMGERLMNLYNIGGVKFHFKEEAEQFLEYLNGRLAWYYLKKNEETPHSD
jgi:hypothetical protein